MSSIEIGKIINSQDRTQPVRDIIEKAFRNKAIVKDINLDNAEVVVTLQSNETNEISTLKVSLDAKNIAQIYPNPYIKGFVECYDNIADAFNQSKELFVP